MRSRPRRSPRTTAWVVVVAAVAAARFSLPDAVLAGQSWSITASPTTISAGVATSVRITATNTSGNNGGGEAIGCIRIVIPAGFDVQSTALVSVPPGRSWAVTTTGGGSSTVTASAASDGDRIVGSPELESIVFDVTVLNTQTGTWNWTANEFNKGDCSGSFAQPIQLNIEVANSNGAPVATGDAWTVIHDRDLSIAAPGVLANDSDPDTDPLTAVLDTGPGNGSLTLNPDGSIDYRPAVGFVGADSFTYHASDGAASSAPVTVSLTVTNTAPVAVGDAYSVVKNVTRSVAAPGMLANDTDADGDALAVTLVSGPGNGTVTVSADGSFDYTPTTGYEGGDVFTYRVDDGAGTATATVTLTIANDPPTAVDDAYAALVNVPLTVGSAAGVLANDTDPNSEALTASVVTGPSSGSLALQADGSFVYTPNPLFTGTDSFTYSASDGSLSAAATVTISVANVGPSAVDDSVTLVHDRTLTVAAPGVLANDVDLNGDTLSAGLVTAPANGTLTLAADGGYVYIPDAGFTGTDSFTYAADDGGVQSAPATVVVTVTNAAPVTSLDTYATPKNVDLAGAAGVLANDVDPDGDPMTATVVSPPATGTLSLAADGSFTFVPAAGWTGTVTFVYAASDGLASATASATIVVTNSTPIAVADTVTVARNGTLLVAAPGVLANDQDENGDALSATLVGAPALGSLSFAPDGSYTYVPVPGAVGTDSFTYVVSDGSATSSPATVSIEIVNTPPVVVSSAHTVVHDRALAVGAPDGALAGAGDADGDALTASLVSGPSFGSLTFSPDGSFSYDPLPGYTGTDTFDFSASDGVTASTATVSLIVVNSAPTASADAYTMSEGDTLSIAAPGVLANDADADGDSLIAVIATTPSNGVVVLAADGGLVYVPNPGFAGTDRFTYRASDLIAQSAPARVTISVRPGPTSTPTPTPTPTPAPTSTPSPTPDPASPDPSASPAPSASPSLAPEPSTAPTPGPTDGPPASGPPAPRPEPTMRPAGADLFAVPGAYGGGPIAVDMAAVGFGDLGGLFLWAVPGLVVSVPGLLVMLVVGAQAFGGLAWLPVARRRLGSFGIRRRAGEATARR